MHTKLIGIGALFLALIACGRGGAQDGPSGDDTDATAPSGEAAIEAALEEDLTFLVSASALASSVAALEEATFRDEDTACYDTAYGGCSICYELVGGPATGTFTVSQDAECGVSVAVEEASASYTLTELSLSGDWDGSPLNGNYLITASGGTTSELLVDGPTDNDPWAFDASWNLESLEVNTLDYEFANAHAVLTYTGFGDQDWSADVTLTASSVSGTISRADGDCALAGTVDAETVDVFLDCD